MANQLQQITQAREELRRTIATCSTRMQVRENKIRGFRESTLQSNEHLAAAIQDAEQAMDQVKADHNRAAADSGDGAVLQRRRRSHMDSLAAQKAATVALQNEVAKLRAGGAERQLSVARREQLQEEEHEVLSPPPPTPLSHAHAHTPQHLIIGLDPKHKRPILA